MNRRWTLVNADFAIGYLLMVIDDKIARRFYITRLRRLQKELKVNSFCFWAYLH